MAPHDHLAPAPAEEARRRRRTTRAGDDSRLAAKMAGRAQLVDDARRPAGDTTLLATSCVAIGREILSRFTEPGSTRIMMAWSTSPVSSEAKIAVSVRRTRRAAQAIRHQCQRVLQTGRGDAVAMQRAPASTNAIVSRPWRTTDARRARGQARLVDRARIDADSNAKRFGKLMRESSGHRAGLLHGPGVADKV
jgi:hypothetical protein